MNYNILEQSRTLLSSTNVLSIFKSISQDEFWVNAEQPKHGCLCSEIILVIHSLISNSFMKLQPFLSKTQIFEDYYEFILMKHLVWNFAGSL